MKCGDCKHFRRIPPVLLGEQLSESGIGECRRRPPMWVDEIFMPVCPRGTSGKGTVAIAGMACWPKVHPLLGGCGEFSEGVRRTGTSRMRSGQQRRGAAWLIHKDSDDLAGGKLRYYLTPDEGVADGEDKLTLAP